MKMFCAVWLLFFLAYPAAKAQSLLHVTKKKFKNQFLNYINAKRAQGCNCGTTYMKPVQPLTWNEQLAGAAANHAKDMYQNQYFSHQSKGGSNMQDRLIRAGYNYKGYQSYTIGENIAYGQQSINEVIAGWFKSAEHCKNLMNPAFTEIGIAEDNYYWVQDFGGRTKF